MRVGTDRGGRGAEASCALQLAVRRLLEAEFAAIVRPCLPVDLERVEATRYDPLPEVAFNPPEPFERPVIERLTSRPYRDVAFRRKKRAANDDRCAMSGLRLCNGGGRPEVNGARIRPVQRQGSDAVRNVLALSGRLHRMFDRGLMSVADDRSILVARNQVPREVIDQPHPANLRWHRENVWGEVGLERPSPVTEWRTGGKARR